MNSRFLIGFALTLFVLPARSFAADSGGLVVSMATLGDRVRSQNPDLAAARLRIREALGRMKQAGKPSNPRLETDLEAGSRFREGSARIGLMQSFPVTAKLQLEKDISVAELRAAEAEVREVERKLIAGAKEELVKVLAIRQQRALRREQSEVSGKLADFITRAAEKGEGSILDAGQAKLEAARLVTEMRQLDAEEASSIGKLKPLLGMATNAKLLPSGDLAPIGIPGTGSSTSRRPDLQVARVEAQAAATEVELERARKYDDLDAGIFAGADRSEDAPEGTKTEGMIGLKLSIPLPLWNDNSGNIEAAQAKQERKQLEIVALDRSIRLEAEAARAEMVQWAKLEKEIGSDLLPMADKQSELAETAWRNGQGELQLALRAREQRLQLASSRLDALRDFHLARVRYETALNQP